jgi:Ca2+-binding EF-hand superfamily protein
MANNSPGSDKNGAVDDTKAGALSVDVGQAAKMFEDSYKLLDGDKDGFVTKEELSTAARATNISDEQELVFTTLAELADDVQKLSRDEWFGDNNGITRADMGKLGSLDGKKGSAFENKVYKDVADKLARGLDTHDPQVFRDTGLKYFADIDQNGSGSLDRLELESFLKRNSGNPRGAAVASVMLEHFDDVTKMAPGGYIKHAQAQSLNFYMYDGYSGGEISRQDLKNLTALRLAPQTEVDAAKSSEYFKTRVKGGVLFAGGAACMVAGVGAALVPEPSVSKAAAVGAFGLGTLTATAGGAMLFRSKDPAIEYVYSKVEHQRDAMKQWNYFNR